MPDASAPASRPSLVDRAFRRVDIAPLAWFRFVFGLILCIEAGRYLAKGWVREYYIAPAFHFKFYGFGWVQAWPGLGMYLHFAVLFLAAMGVMAGLFYRVAIVTWFLGFTYVFLLDQTRFLNHHYLVCLISFLLIFAPAHRAFSLDAWRRPGLRSSTTPAWPLWLLRGQICIVYFMAGVAKLNGDWLQGEPMRNWLLKRMDYAVVGPYFDQPWLPYFFTYAGLGYDLLVAPMLWWRRTRWLAFGLAAVFNATNGWLFNIGIFPWMAFSATFLLYCPCLPKPFPWLWRESSGSGPRLVPVPVPGPVSRRRQRWITGLVVSYIALQLLVPLRHWLYPGDVAWTEEGHRFAWRMMLRKKSGDLLVNVRDPATGESWKVFPREYLTDEQYGKACTRPDMILQLCHHIAKDIAERGTPNVEVRVVAMAALNGRRSELFIDPEVDLARERRSLRHAPWILPFQPSPILPPQCRRWSGVRTESEASNFKFRTVRFDQGNQAVTVLRTRLPSHPGLVPGTSAR